MAFLSLFAAGGIPVPDNSVWDWFLLNVFDFIVNYGWRVLVFTLLLKLAMFPLDLFQRVKMRKNQKITERNKPEMDKIQKMYGSDKTLLAQKQMELNKKEGFSYFSSCLPMIATMVVFITLFTSMTYISEYQNMDAYVQMYNEYKVVYETETEKGTESSVAKDKAQDAVVKFYDSEVKVSFLWIKNIWSPDVPWTSPIKDYNNFKTSTGKFFNDPKLCGMETSEFDTMKSSAMYNDVTLKLRESPDNNTNGYLILVILAVGLNLASQFITQRQQKKSGMAQQNMGTAMKVMMVVMPLMIGFFALSYTAAFSLYLCVSSLGTIIISVMMSGIMKLMDMREAKGQAVEVVQKYGSTKKNKLNIEKSKDGIIRYGRPDPKEISAKYQQKSGDKKDIFSIDTKEISAKNQKNDKKKDNYNTDPKKKK